MVSKYTRFTREDSILIFKCIQENKNLIDAFKEAGKILDRPVSSIKSHYCYSKFFEEIKNKRKEDRKAHKDKVLEILSKEIKQSPENLQQAFRNTSQKTGLTTGTIHNAYYSDKSYASKNKIGVCFSLISENKITHNGKNSSTELTKKTKAKNKSLISFFKNLFNNKNK